MKIATIGRETSAADWGGLWEKAGHEVTKLGRDGGDVSSAEVVLLAARSPRRSTAYGVWTGRP